MGHGLLRRKCVKVNWYVLFNVLYICHRSSYSDSEPRLLPHSRFSVVIMVKSPDVRSVYTLLLFHSYSDTRHLKAKRCFHGIVKKRLGEHKPSFLSHSAGE